MAKSLETANDAAKLISFDFVQSDPSFFSSTDLANVMSIYNIFHHLASASHAAVISMVHEEALSRSIGILAKAMKYLQPPPAEIPDETPVDPTVDTSASSSRVSLIPLNCSVSTFNIEHRRSKLNQS